MNDELFASAHMTFFGFLTYKDWFSGVARRVTAFIFLQKKTYFDAFSECLLVFSSPVSSCMNFGGTWMN